MISYNRNQSIDLTGFYMISAASVMKGLMPGGNKKVTHIGLRLSHYLYDSYYLHYSRHDSSIPCMAVAMIYRGTTATKQPLLWKMKETSKNESKLRFSWR